MKKNFLFGLILFVVSVGLAFTVGCKANRECVVLPAGTDGSYGTEGSYVLFGEWPQSLKADDVTVSSKKEEVNGWECFKGSDGFYYVKAEAKPYDNYKFDNGEAIKKGEYYYFKLEPIKWRVVTDDYQGGKLLVAENILEAGHYNSEWNNNYKNSEIRAWLNDDFINSAFTKSAMENINTVTVDNSVKSTGYSSNDNACENTEDKIFLLSYEEVTKNSYGFDSNEWKDDTAKRRKTTDYSRATGAYSDINEEYKNNGWLWLRSPFDYSNFVVRVVHGGGEAYESNVVSFAEGGVVPALSMTF